MCRTPGPTLGRQDAVDPDEDAQASPPTPRASQLQHKRLSLRPSGTSLSLNVLQRDIKEAFTRRCSSLRRKPAPRAPFGQTLAAAAATSSTVTDSGRDAVSILVTEPSPEGGVPVRPPLLRQQSEATVVHVLVHRESEEYRDEVHEEEPEPEPEPESWDTADGERFF